MNLFGSLTLAGLEACEACVAADRKQVSRYLQVFEAFVLSCSAGAYQERNVPRISVVTPAVCCYVYES